MTLRGITVRRARIATGLVMFTFLTTHLGNHALGLVSLQTMEDGRDWFLWVWGNAAGNAVLFAAFLAHFLLALWAIYRRRRLVHMPFSEALQLTTGLLIIPGLAEHVVLTVVAFKLYASTDDYKTMIWFLACIAPQKGVWQAIVLIIAWTHACIGLWAWMRIRPWYARVAPYAFAFALLWPALAIMGFIAAARDLMHLVRDPVWTQALIDAANFPPTTAVLDAIWFWIIATFTGALALTLILRWLRIYLEWRAGRFRIAYPDGREIAVPLGMSILEASQLCGIPHASVCGGRGRCSTCRVRVTAGLDALPAPSPQETAVLARAGAAIDVRLACQLRPKADVAVVPLLPANVGPRGAWPRPSHLEGQEKEIVILFADLRGFTTLAQNRLPYDVVFILNRYFNAMGRAIEMHGGHVDKFIGDGVMALFGVDDGPTRGARAALAAARAMGEALAVLNRSLSSGLERELKLGIGIHMGPAIVGEMGYGRAVSLTAIGDAVNTASRLESLTKDYTAELVVSDAVARAAGMDLSAFPAHEATVRGREGTLAVRALPRAGDLPEPAVAA